MSVLWDVIRTTISAITNVSANTTGKFAGVLPQENFLGTMDGTVNFHIATNGGVEFEVPFYSRNLFVFSFARWFSNGSDSFDDYWNQAWSAKTLLKTTSGQTNIVVQDFATAEDFTFLRFQGAPFFSGTVSG